MNHPQETPKLPSGGNFNRKAADIPVAQPPQETGIDILERYFRKYTATPQGINLSKIDEAFEKSKVNAAQALLQLFEKEAVEIDGYMLVKAVATGETIKVPVTGEAVPLSKLRELLGGTK